MNPYRGMNCCVDMEKFLYGREDLIEVLRSRLMRRMDTLLLGPEGVGKSSLLLCAFSWEFRKMMAERQILITPPFAFPLDLERDRIFPYLIEQLISALVPLDDATEVRIREAIHRKMAEQLEPRATFSSVVNMLRDEWGYSFCMVIDNFERFTTSREVTMEHHETMRAMLERGYLRFVVATNYDLSTDSLPDNVKGSYLLQRFRDCEVLVAGLEENAAAVMLNGMMTSMLQDRLSQRQMIRGAEFTMAMQLAELGLKQSMTDMLGSRLQQMMTLTGGVPALVLMAAAEAYDFLKGNRGEALSDEQWSKICERTRKGANQLMDHWSRFLTEEQLVVLKKLAHRAAPGNDEEEGLMGYIAKYRGLLVCDEQDFFSHAVGLFAEYVPSVVYSSQSIPVSDGPVF